MTDAPVIGVTGWKNSGKTTLVEKLVRELTGRGYKIATVKHAHHAFDIDHEGTDSYRHRLAGAGEVAIVSGARWALMHEIGEGKEPDMDEIVARLAPCDLVVVEGYKREPHPKIEVRRAGAPKDLPLAADEFNIVAIAADYKVGDAVEQLDLNDIVAVADFVIAYHGLDAKTASDDRQAS